MQIDVESIVSNWLKENGYNGLYNDGECACEVDALFLCDCGIPYCKPGYLYPCDCGDHDWHIGEYMLCDKCQTYDYPMSCPIWCHNYGEEI